MPCWVLPEFTPATAGAVFASTTARVRAGPSVGPGQRTVALNGRRLPPLEIFSEHRLEGARELVAKILAQFPVLPDSGGG